MNFAKFTFYTFVGCVSWVLALTYLGYYLGENWDEVGNFLHYLDYAVALAVLAGPFICSCADALDLRARNPYTNEYICRSILRIISCRFFWASENPLKTLTFLTGKTKLSYPKWGPIIRRQAYEGVCFEFEAHLCGPCGGRRYGGYGCRSCYGAECR
jgi:hypothetical protein